MSDLAIWSPGVWVALGWQQGRDLERRANLPAGDRLARGKIKDGTLK